LLRRTVGLDLPCSFGVALFELVELLLGRAEAATA
jgi:hypothetical protein